MKHYIYSNKTTCPPCRFLVDALDNDLPNWRDKVEYVDLTKDLTPEQDALISKLGIRSIPALVNENEIVGVGFSKIYNFVKDLS